MVINILGEPTFIDKKEYCSTYYLVYATLGLYRRGFEFDVVINDDKLVGVSVEFNDFGVYKCYKNFCYGLYNSEKLEELYSLSSK